MKRFISILLSVIMLLSLAALAACNDAESEPSGDPTQAVTTAAQTDNSAGEQDDTAITLAAGIVPSTDVEILVVMMEYIKENLAVKDIDFQYSATMFDVPKYIELIENYVTMGAGIIVVVPMDTSGIESAALAAEEAGTRIVFVSSPPGYGDEISGGIYSDYYEAGYEMGKMGVTWARGKYPDADSIPVALTVGEADADSIARTTGMRDAANEDDLCYIDYEVWNATTVDDGFNFMESALTANAAIRVFLCYESNSAIGADNFLQAYVPANGLDLADFGIFTVGISEAAVALVEASASDEAALRGIVAYAAAEPGEPVMEVINAILNGEDLPYWLIEDTWNLNGFGY